jgi:hypothetical protein
VILGPQYANEVRSHEALSFGRAVAYDFHAQIPGFEPFKEGTGAERVLQDVVRMRLTQSLGELILHSECSERNRGLISFRSRNKATIR